jgi:hypothetical protein
MAINPTALSFHVVETRKDEKPLPASRHLTLENNGQVIQVWPNGAAFFARQMKTIGLLLDSSNKPVLSTISGSVELYGEPSQSPNNGTPIFPIWSHEDESAVNRLRAREQLQPWADAKRQEWISVPRLVDGLRYWQNDFHAEAQIVAALKARKANGQPLQGPYAVVASQAVCLICKHYLHDFAVDDGVESRVYESVSGSTGKGKPSSRSGCSLIATKLYPRPQRYVARRVLPADSLQEHGEFGEADDPLR